MDAPFSEMIRLGIPMIPARRARQFVFFKNNEPCAACAIGTGLVAAGIDCRSGSRFLEVAFQRWPILHRRAVSPASGIDYELLVTASELFETYSWSREEVAAFIAEKEREEEEQKAAVLGVGVEAK